MKLETQVLPYLKGEKFSNGLTINCNYFEKIPKRLDLIKELVTGKKVVHLGCLDHLPLIDEKVAKGQWLHQQLNNVSEKCIGVDINQETFDYVKEKHNINNIVIADITGDPIPEIKTEKWDYAILGELLEHIDNPVLFLSEIKKKYEGCIDKMVITVPNAFTESNFKMARQSKEFINTDHRYWFTPYTLAKVLWHAGMETEEILFANHIRPTTAELVKRKAYKMLSIPLKERFTYASSIVAIARLK